MTIPANFPLIVLTVLVYIARHWVHEVDPILPLLLLMIRPDQPMMPAIAEKKTDALPPASAAG
jgi:hypothetical protein